MKEKILELVEKLKSSVSFVELERNIPAFRGNKSLQSSEYHNLVYWDGISEEGINALTELALSDIIKIQACPIIYYAIDGGNLSLPIAKQKRDYKDPHWYPVAISIA